jgi:hypothetical protein
MSEFGYHRAPPPPEMHHQRLVNIRLKDRSTLRLICMTLVYIGSLIMQGSLGRASGCDQLKITIGAEIGAFEVLLTKHGVGMRPAHSVKL